MKKLIVLILTLLFCLPACAEPLLQEEHILTSPFADEIASFGFEQKLEGFVEPGDCVVRARYLLRLPEDITNLDEHILTAYSGMESIQLIEYGFPYIGSILQSGFVCVGVDSAGDLHILPTPSDIVARTYDRSIFDCIDIICLDDGTL
ncbi:MAG: hypothetical protein J6K55_14030 [Clostridia bacterium]|nr:hypothetical protein [Clostridia bacterium]